MHRHGRRVDVGEGLVHLIHQQDRNGNGTRRQGNQRGDHIACAEVEDREDAESVIGDRGKSVAKRCAPEGRLAGLRVPAVVRG